MINHIESLFVQNIDYKVSGRLPLVGACVLLWCNISTLDVNGHEREVDGRCKIALNSMVDSLVLIPYHWHLKDHKWKSNSSRWVKGKRQNQQIWNEGPSPKVKWEKAKAYRSQKAKVYVTVCDTQPKPPLAITIFPLLIMKQSTILASLTKSAGLHMPMLKDTSYMYMMISYSYHAQE